jgi:hypothetical protein
VVLLGDTNEFWAEDFEPGRAPREREDLLVCGDELVWKASPYLRRWGRFSGEGAHRLKDGVLQLFIHTARCNMERAGGGIAPNCRSTHEKQLKLLQGP